MTTKKKIKLIEFSFPMYNRRSNKAFTAIIKGKDYDDAKVKAKVKFPYPIYDFEWN